MNNEFNIIEYLSGLTQYVFDEAVLKVIARHRNVLDVEDYDLLTQKDRELLYADLLYTAYTSPSQWASSTQTHGAYSREIGSQTMNAYERERLYNIFVRIYRKYEDERLYETEEDKNTLQWLDY